MRFQEGADGDRISLSASITATTDPGLLHDRLSVVRGEVCPTPWGDLWDIRWLDPGQGEEEVQSSCVLGVEGSCTDRRCLHGDLFDALVDADHAFEAAAARIRAGYLVTRVAPGAVTVRTVGARGWPSGTQRIVIRLTDDVCVTEGLHHVDDELCVTVGYHCLGRALETPCTATPFTRIPELDRASVLGAFDPDALALRLAAGASVPLLSHTAPVLGNWDVPALSLQRIGLSPDATVRYRFRPLVSVSGSDVRCRICSDLAAVRPGGLVVCPHRELQALGAAVVHALRAEDRRCAQVAELEARLEWQRARDRITPWERPGRAPRRPGR